MSQMILKEHKTVEDSKKNTGSYYTPKVLSDFLTKHILHNYIEALDLSVLEPSCGDGQFIESFFGNLDIQRGYNIELDLLDIDNDELSKAKNHTPNSDNVRTNAYCHDYLEFFLERDNSYSLIFGNPPYIKKGNLKKEQIEICEKVHQEAKNYCSKINSSGTIKNIWTAFVEAAIMSLDDRGVLCFVIPAEILQVKYSKELRDAITDEFDRVEVFAFNELIFDGIQQDVVALIGVKGVEDLNEHGFSFYHVETLEDLNEPRFTEKHSNIHRTTLDKWTNYILSDEELNFVDNYRSQFNNIKNYTEKAQVGIVSAANEFFIVNDEKLKKNGLHRLKNVSKRILPKGDVVPVMALFQDEDFENKSKKYFGSFANKYFTEGEKVKDNDKGELHLRFKMKKRENWYHVPSVWISEGLFVKRSHLYPKMFVNNAQVLATDSFYRIETKKEFNIKKLVFSFYNSLTFVLAELEGRFYGGGVLELTPNEFKNLAIPYSDRITNKDIVKLDKMLRNNEGIESILAFTNSILIPNSDYVELERIRKVLVNRRTKKSELDIEVINTISKNKELTKVEAV